MSTASEKKLKQLLHKAHWNIKFNRDPSPIRFLFARKSQHENLDVDFHPQVGDYGHFDWNNKFVKEGNIYNPVDGSVMPAYPIPYHGLCIDQEFMHDLDDYNCLQGALAREQIDAVTLNTAMAPIVKEIQLERDDKPMVMKKSIVRHIIGRKGNYESHIQKVQEKSFNDLVLLHRSNGNTKRFELSSKSKEYFYLNKQRKRRHCAMSFFTGLKMKLMDDELERSLRKVRPDLKRKVIVTQTMSCNGYLAYRSDIKRRTGVEFDVYPREKHPNNPEEYWRKFKIGGDGLQDAKIWNTMPCSHSGQTGEKSFGRELKRRTVFFETQRI